MSDELLGEGGEGVSRRSMLKKSALVGGTMVWAAPVVSSFTSPAFGQDEGTPEFTGDKGISYIALVYSCTSTGTRYIKFDNINSDGSATCYTGSFETPQCTFSDTSGQTEDESQCDLFTLTVLETDEDGEPTIVQVTIDGNEDECIIQGKGLGKCGNPEQPQSGGECIEGVVTDGGRTVTFHNCGV